MSNDLTSRGFMIRNADQADIPAIRVMQERSMWVLGGSFYRPVQIGGFVSEFGTMDDALVAEGQFLVAENDSGAIIGSGGWTRLKPGYAVGLRDEGHAAGEPTVRSVFVDPAAVRRGIASAIMMRIERDVGARGIQALHLTATLSGIAFYQHLGYRAKEALSICLSNQSRFACVRMVKQLPNSGGRGT